MKSTLLLNIWLRNSPGTKPTSPEKNPTEWMACSSCIRFLMCVIDDFTHFSPFLVCFSSSYSPMLRMSFIVFSTRGTTIMRLTENRCRKTLSLVLHIFRIWVHSSHFYFHFSKGDHKKRPKCSKTRGPRWRYIYASWSRKGKMFKLKLFFIQISYLNVLCFFWTILSNLHPQANEQIHQENFGKLPLLKTPEVTTEYCCH